MLLLILFSKNITGPKTAPCGTLDITLTQYFDSYPSTIYRSLFIKNLLLCWHYNS